MLFLCIDDSDGSGSDSRSAVPSKMHGQGNQSVSSLDKSEDTSDDESDDTHSSTSYLPDVDESDIGDVSTKVLS